MMRKYLAILNFAFASLVALSTVSPGSADAVLRGAPTPNPPVAVPGSELRHNVATVKQGYEFVKNGAGVNVVSTRYSRIMGTYVCPCDRTDGGKCDLVFSPTYLTCKGGSCSGGSCLLTAAPVVMRQ